AFSAVPGSGVLSLPQASPCGVSPRPLIPQESRIFHLLRFVLHPGFLPYKDPNTLVFKYKGGNIMLDRKLLRNHFEDIKARLEKRGEDLSELVNFGALDERRRKIIARVEEIKAKRNEASKRISEYKREKKDTTALIEEMQTVSDEIKELDKELVDVEEKLDHVMYSIPNIPHESVPVGEDEDDNVEVRTWGEKPAFSFEPEPHWDVATNLAILDFERASKVAGSRFVFYKGLGARLERALMSFMMDLHADEHGYEEMIPPFLVNRQSMTGTGQLPKFEEDAFLIED